MVVSDKPTRFFFFAILTLVFCSSLSAQTESKYERLREWSDSTGKFKVQAKISLLNRESVVIEKEDGSTTNIALSKLSIADKEFIDDYKKSQFSKVKANARDSIFAKDVVRFYTLYLNQGFADAEQTEHAESQIATYKEAAEENAIILSNELVPESELLKRQADAEGMVTKWIEEGRGEKDKLLKSAIKVDPTAIEASILLALYEELHEASFKTSQRFLSDAIKRGKRYLPIANDVDRNNLLVAMNNLGVSYARTDQVPKALRVWMEADEISNYELPTDIKYNIAKMWRMLKNQRSGVIADRSSRSETEEFVETTGSSGRSGGWKIICPTNRKGKTRKGLDFVLANREAQKIFNGTFLDTRCVHCTGHSIIDCPNRKCKNGKTENPVYGMRKVTFPDGTVKNTGRGIIRIDWINCSTCRGKRQIDCPCCIKGMQNN